MNTQNETVVGSEMMKRLHEANLDSGYEPVPRELEAKARQLLHGFRNAVANTDDDFKRRLRNINKRKRREGVRGY